MLRYIYQTEKTTNRLKSAEATDPLKRDSTTKGFYNEGAFNQLIRFFYAAHIKTEPTYKGSRGTIPVCNPRDSANRSLNNAATKIEKDLNDWRGKVFSHTPDPISTMSDEISLFVPRKYRG